MDTIERDLRLEDHSAPLKQILMGGAGNTASLGSQGHQPRRAGPAHSTTAFLNDTIFEDEEGEESGSGSSNVRQVISRESSLLGSGSSSKKKLFGGGMQKPKERLSRIF